MKEREFIDTIDVESLSEQELEVWYEAYVGIIKDRKTLELMLLSSFPIEQYIDNEKEMPTKVRRAFIRAMQWKRGQIQPKGVG